MSFGPVAIFWDYGKLFDLITAHSMSRRSHALASSLENCSPHHNSGSNAIDNIRQIAHRYGPVIQFKAYLELSEQTSPKSLGLRSELQSCGVSLTDCPHNGRKDVADKMMIGAVTALVALWLVVEHHIPVDMLTYAIDTPAPATIILISGDRDFVYAVSVLRFRRYHVVVIAPGSAHVSLKSRASDVLDWDQDVLGKPAREVHARHVSVDVSFGRSSTVESEAGTKTSRRHSFKENYTQAQARSSHAPITGRLTRPDTETLRDTLRIPMITSLPTTPRYHSRTPGLDTTALSPEEESSAVTIDTNVLRTGLNIAESNANTPISPNVTVRLILIIRNSLTATSYF